jgi:energy-coupling factor transport system ATP-binding protein
MPASLACALRGVSFAYPGGSPVLAGLDLEIRQGEWVALLGPNGSGKSTLARLLNALLIPTQGGCFVYGRDTREEEGIGDIRRDVAMVFQNPENQIVASVVEEDVAFGPECLGMPPSEIRLRVDWALERTGLSEKRRKASYALSGGEKQRLALAGALALRPRCLVLDEATAMLDPAARRDLVSLLRDLREEGMTLIQITHRLEEIPDADRVVVLQGGGIRFDGSAAEFLERSSQVVEWGFVAPPLLRLRDALVRSSRIPPGTPARVDDLVRALCASA